jgi:hypothetical protein
MPTAASVETEGIVVDLVPRVVRGPHIVAYVMSDGTIQRPGKPFEPREAATEFQSGVLSGDGWLLWWDRRTV